ncbi:MAG: transcription antitermination factor NusB [Pseudomonadota bacterium]
MSRTARKKNNGLTTAARLAAVQALYQVELGAAGPEDALATVIARGATLDETGLAAEADPEIASIIVRGVTEGATQERLDEMIEGALAEDWSLARLEILMRAILRAGAFELLDRPDVPAKVVINEYVDVANAFFDRGEPGMVNAVLDKLAHGLRDAEFAAAEAASAGRG